MTKEQEEAIKYLEESILIYKNAIPKMSKAIETVLNTAELAEKSAEIEKYKYLYQKALADLVKVEKKNMQKDKQRDLMLKYINYLSDELVQATGRNELEFCNGNRCCKDSDYSCEQCIEQYFERKVEE